MGEWQKKKTKVLFFATVVTRQLFNTQFGVFLIKTTMSQMILSDK